jgi:hypothetical protein
LGESMLFESLLLKKALLGIRGVAGLRKLLDLVPALRPETPQTIKQSFHYDLIANIDKKYPPDATTLEKPSRTKHSKLREERMAEYGRWYIYRADCYWGRTSTRERYMSAWLYVTAATLYERANQPGQAGDAYHFAANSFRELGAYRASIDYYCEASRLGNREWSLRSLYRAKSVARAAGDAKEEARVDARIGEIASASKDG